MTPPVPRATLDARVRGTLRFVLLSVAGRLGDRFAAVYLWISRRQLADLLGRLRSGRPRSHPLHDAETSKFSQNGEDGVIAALVEQIGAPDRCFVEIGAADGAENCTRNLAEQGWRGVWVEADPERAVRARNLGLDVEVVGRPAYRESVATMLADAGTPIAFDVLVVDIDSDDFGVLDAVLARFEPRIVVAEYNPAFRPGEWWAMGTKGSGWDGTFRHGASLEALVGVATAHGYSLVHCDRMGVNAFFVRTALIDDDHRWLAERTLDNTYQPPSFSLNPGGHPLSPRVLNPMEALDRGEYSRLGLSDAQLEITPDSVAPGEPIGVSVLLTNPTDRHLTSQNPHAVNLNARWVDAGSSAEGPADDAVRTPLPRPIPPRSSTRLVLWLRAPDQAGSHRLRVTLVNEGLPWLESVGGPHSFADLSITVRG